MKYKNQCRLCFGQVYSQIKCALRLQSASFHKVRSEFSPISTQLASVLFWTLSSPSGWFVDQGALYKGTRLWECLDFLSRNSVAYTDPSCFRALLVTHSKASASPLRWRPMKYPSGFEVVELRCLARNLFSALLATITSEPCWKCQWPDISWDDFLNP